MFLRNVDFVDGVAVVDSCDDSPFLIRTADNTPPTQVLGGLHAKRKWTWLNFYGASLQPVSATVGQAFKLLNRSHVASTRAARGKIAASRDAVN